jgi:Domain of unknown function (DUF6968)
MEIIAEREVMLISKTGQRKTICLQIGKPQRAADHEHDWVCSVAAKGLGIRIPSICGVDAWQALMLGIQLLESILNSKLKSGTRLFCPTARKEISVSELFHKLPA